MPSRRFLGADSAVILWLYFTLLLLAGLAVIALDHWRARRAAAD